MHNYRFDPRSPGFKEPKGQIERLFALIHILKYDRRRQIDALADLLKVSTKTIGRDLKLLERFFALDQDDKNRPFIFLEEDDYGMYLHITDEEIKYLRSVLEGIDDKIGMQLARKLSNDMFLQDDQPAFLASHIQNVKRAVNFEKKIKFNYHSGKNLFATERILEPVDVLDRRFMVAYDPKASASKIYAFERIDGAIELLEDKVEHKKKHRKLKADIFGMHTGKVYHVKLLLKSRAYLLLREEYPRSIDKMSRSQEQDYPWIYDDHVFGLEGIGRFVMGLLDEIKIVESKDLVNYIDNSIKKHFKEQ